MTEVAHPDDLVSLLRGESTNAEVARAAAHLDTCGDCRAELSELAIGHALLARTAETLGQASKPVSLPEVISPAPRPVHRPRWRRASGPVGTVGLVAAAALLIAGTAGVTRSLMGDDATKDVPVARQEVADLAAVDGDGTGQVVIVNHRETVQLTFEAQDLPPLDEGQFYYGWLLDPETNKMLPLGQIGSDGKTSIEVSTKLLTRYGAIDVSIEDDDGDPGHSVTSVLRGDFDAAAVV